MPRALQGVGGAVLFPATLSLVNTLFAEGPERNRALSIWAGAGASGLILGSLLGGVLTSAFGWQAVFFVNVPLAGLAILHAVPLIPADPPRAAGRRFDLPGALCVTAGATLVVFTLVQGPAIMIGSQLGGGMITRYGVRATLLGSLATGAAGNRDLRTFPVGTRSYVTVVARADRARPRSGRCLRHHVRRRRDGRRRA